MGERVWRRSSGRRSSKRVSASGPCTLTSLVAQRHREGERAAVSELRLHCEVAVVHPCDLTRKPQAKTGALYVDGAFDAAEAGEEQLLVGDRDADAAVFHHHLGVLAVAEHRDVDLAATG